MLSPELKTIDTEVQTSFNSLEEELRKLREDKEILEGKIRGYLTLSEICHEYKEDLRKLQIEYKKLLEKEQMKAQHLYSESPAPTNDLERHNGPDFEQRTTKNPNPSTTALSNTDIATQLARDRNIQTEELFSPGPSDNDHSPTTELTGNIHLKSLSHDIHDVSAKLSTPPSIVQEEKFPMQESLAGEDALVHRSGSHHPSNSLTGMGFDLSSSGDMSLGHSATFYKRSEPVDLMNFSNTPQVATKDLSQRHEKALDEVLKSIRPEDGEKVTSVVKHYTEKMKTTIQCQQKAYGILIDENRDLKNKMQMMERDKVLLMDRIRKLEQEKYDLSSTRSGSPDELQAAGWVHVDKETKGDTQMIETSVEVTKQIDKLQLRSSGKLDDLKWLQAHYLKLTESNMRWSDEWDKLKFHSDQRLQAVERERDRLEKTLTEKRVEEEAFRRDFEKVVAQLKEKANEEENSKEEALLQLTTSNNRQEQMQKQIAELSDKVSALRREKQAKDSEIQVLRQNLTTSKPNTTSKTPHDGKSVDLQTENDVLRQQLLVFQEDFDRERQDRATAQSLKDDYKKQNESLKKRVRHVENKHATVERQLKMAEDTSRRTLTENERLQQEVTDLKNQLRQEQERQRNMMVGCFPQQQQQLQHHQPMMQQSGHIAPPTQPMYQGHQMAAPYMPQHQYTQVPPTQQYQAAGGYIQGSGSQTPVRAAQSQYAQAGQQQGRAIEHLPGSWSCNQCTYVNYPGRTVCEMCGYIQSPTTQNNFRYPGSGGDILMPRGEENQQHQPPRAPFPQYTYATPGQPNLNPNPGNRAV